MRSWPRRWNRRFRCYLRVRKRIDAPSCWSADSLSDRNKRIGALDSGRRFGESLRIRQREQGREQRHAGLCFGFAEERAHVDLDGAE